MRDEKEYGALLTCSLKALKCIIDEFITKDEALIDYDYQSRESIGAD